MDHRRDDDEPGQHHERHQRPSSRHSGPAFGVAILVPPAVTVAIPRTPTHNGLLTVPELHDTRPILTSGDVAPIDAARPRKQTVRNGKRAASPAVKERDI
jgi:hypothetical protein